MPPSASAFQSAYYESYASEGRHDACWRCDIAVDVDVVESTWPTVLCMYLLYFAD